MKIRRKVSCSPRKLPPLQIRQSLKACQDISSVNNLLKYSEYDDDFSPSLTMSLIMLKRIIIILNGPWRLTNRDWMDIKNSFCHIRLKLEETENPTKIKWQIVLIKVLLHKRSEKSRMDHNLLEQLISTMKKGLIQVCCCFFNYFFYNQLHTYVLQFITCTHLLNAMLVMSWI